jgi:23S rRNA (cytidine1920-2'-O)/16S rRNA (cytidine1409-2'-O)-methyltransferase
MKRRIDAVLVDRGLAPTRARAQALVMAGRVYVGEKRVEKPGALVDDAVHLDVRGDEPFVSRGGVKLDGALTTFALSGFEIAVAGLRCLDIGAGTGGFTDCLLKRGAKSVAAVDVGYGQLAHVLRTNARVSVLERTNARELQPEAIGGAVDLVVVDASFIGLGKLAPAIRRNLKPGGTLVAMIKPQFEVGREEASRTKGVVRDPEVRRGAIDEARTALEAEGFTILAEADSTLPGPKGNVEAFVLCRRND